MDNELENMSDRELLLSIANDIANVRMAINLAVETLQPMLNSPKAKLMFKMFS